MVSEPDLVKDTYDHMDRGLSTPGASHSKENHDLGMFYPVERIEKSQLNKYGNRMRNIIGG